MKNRKPSTRNFVAKYTRQFNKSAVHIDRKRSQKRGYIKHKIKEKGRYEERPFSLYGMMLFSM